MTGKAAAIPWGRGSIPWELPEDVMHPCRKGSRPRKCTPGDALASPVDSRPLGELAREASDAVVVVPDATRAWENIPLMAKAVRNELESAGTKKVTWLVGGGLHRKPTEEEMKEILGSAPLPGDWVSWSDPDRAQDIGIRTSRGTPLAIAPEAAASDLLVVIGGIVYHDVAGFSGGRKGIIPGISGRASVQNNHGLSVAGGVAGLQVNTGRLSGNATAEDMEEYGRLVEERKKVFILNVVPDHVGEPWLYVAGSLSGAWHSGVGYARTLQTLYIPRKAALAVVSSGGYPYDLDLYQATKSVNAVLGALVPGGGLVLCAHLEDGMGPGNFARDFPLAMKDPQALVNQLEESFTIPGFIALKIAHDMGGHPAVLVTSRMDAPFPGLVCLSLDAGLKWISPRIPPGPTVYVPAGNCIFLKAEEQ